MRTASVLAVTALLLTAACTSDEGGSASRTPDARPPATTSAAPTAASPSAAPSPSAEATSAAPVAAPGRYLVTAEFDALRLRDPATGRLVRVLQQTPSGAVDSDVELSRDGASVYALREYGGFAACGRTQVVSIATAGGPARVLVEQADRFSEFAVSPDRRTVARVTSACTSPRERVLVLKDLGTGRERRVALPDDDERSQNGLAYAPDSRHLYVDGRVVDTASADPLRGVAPVDVPERLSVDAQYRPDGRLVLTTAELADADSPLTLVAVDDRTGRPVGAARTLPQQVGAVSYGPAADLLGIRFPTEGDDYVGGPVVRVSGSTVTPLPGVEALAVDWT